MTCIEINPAAFDKRLTLQAVTRVPDGQGGYAESWSDLATVWGSIEPAKGYEKFQASQLATPITHKVTTRYNPDVMTARRLTFKTRVFEIKECLNVNEQDAFLKLVCLELA